MLISSLTAGGNVGLTDLMPAMQAGATAKVTGAQLLHLALVRDLFSDMGQSALALTNPSSVTLTDGRLNVCYMTAAHTVTLPSPTAGNLLGVQVREDSTAALTLDAGASHHIGPGSSQTRPMFAGEHALLMGDGTNWQKIAGKSIKQRVLLTRAVANTSILTYGAWDAIPFDTANPAGSAMADLTNGRANILRAGIYDAIGFAYIAGGANGYCGPSQYGSAPENGYGVITIGGPMFFSTRFNCAVGDAVRLLVLPLSGSSQYVLGPNQPASLEVGEVDPW